MPKKRKKTSRRRSGEPSALSALLFAPWALRRGDYAAQRVLGGGYLGPSVSTTLRLPSSPSSTPSLPTGPSGTPPSTHSPGATPDRPRPPSGPGQGGKGPKSDNR